MPSHRERLIRIIEAARVAHQARVEHGGMTEKESSIALSHDIVDAYLVLGVPFRELRARPSSTPGRRVWDGNTEMTAAEKSAEMGRRKRLGMERKQKMKEGLL